MTAETIAQERREEARRQVRRMLANRPATAHRASYIRHRINADTGERYTDPEIEAAVVFLADLGQIQAEEDADGATKYWRITAAGTLVFERGH